MENLQTSIHKKRTIVVILAIMLTLSLFGGVIDAKAEDIIMNSSPIGLSYEIEGNPKVVMKNASYNYNFSILTNGADIQSIILSDGNFATLEQSDKYQTDFTQRNGKVDVSFSKVRLLGDSNVFTIRVFYKSGRDENIYTTDISYTISQVVILDSSGTGGEVEPEPPIPTLTPQIKVTSFAYGKNAVYYNNKFTLIVSFKNMSGDAIFRNVYANIPIEMGAVVGGSDRVYIGDLSIQESASFSLDYMFSDGVKTGITPFPISFSYEYLKDGQYVSGETTEYISIATVGKAENEGGEEEETPDEPEKLAIQTTTYPKEMMVGDEEEFVFSVVNKGYGMAHHVEVNLYDEDGVKLGSSYLGHMESAKEIHEPKFMLYFETPGTKNLTFVVSYESYKKEPMELVEEIVINVPDFDDGMGGIEDPYVDVFDPLNPEGELPEELVEESGFPVWATVLIIVVVVAGAGVGGFYLVKYIKKKREADLLDEDI